MIRRIALALAMVVLFVPVGMAFGSVEPGDLTGFHKSDPIQNMPDFGQVSNNWCWAAAAANSLYWYAKHGYPEILDDPLKPGFDQDLDSPNGVNGAHRLVEEVARIANVPFCTPIYKSNYLNALQKFLQVHKVDLSAKPSNGFEVHDIIVDPYLLEAYAGPNTDPQLPPGLSAPKPVVDFQPLDPLVALMIRDPTFDDYRRELGRCQDVLLWLCPDGGGDDICHVVTAEGWDPDPTSPTGWKISISDPWNGVGGGAGPDNNTDPNRASHDSYQVLSLDPMQIAYGNQRTVGDMIFISPVPEPASAALLAAGACLALLRKRRGRA